MSARRLHYPAPQCTSSSGAEFPPRKMLHTLGATDFSSAVSGFEDVSAFGQHRKFRPHARKTSGTQGKCSTVFNRLKADTHEGFCSRSMLQGHAPGAKLLRVYQRFLGYTSLILYLREQNFHPAKCSTIFNRLNIWEQAPGAN